jgi:hypothetical protein
MHDGHSDYGVIVNRLDSLEDKTEGARERLVRLETRQDAVWKDLYGNGQPGHLATANDFMSAIKGQFRLLVLLISILGVLVALVAALEANKQIHNGTLKIPEIRIPTISQQVYALLKGPTLDAGAPRTP